MALDGRTPKATVREAGLKLAKQLMSGDAKAVDAGHPAMANPSAVEVSEALQKARTEVGEVATADRAYDEAQTAVAGLREEADELIEEVMRDLRYHLHKLEPASRRRIMRSYGAEFVYLAGEVEEEQEQEE